MPRILHILDHSLPLHSGYTFRTAAILREQRRLGWETLHLTTPKHLAPSALEEEIDGWRFHRTPAAPTMLARLPGGVYLDDMRATARRIDELARRFRPDLLHPHSPVLNALPALWAGRRLRIPVVYEVRASWEDAAVDHGVTREGSWRYRASRALETFALRRADQITTICEGLRQDILARGIDPAKVTVIPNAVEVEQFRFGGLPDEALRARLGLAGAAVVGFIGSFYGYEGLDLLLEAVARLVGSRPELRVLLVGGGLQESALRKQARTLGIADRVIFPGRVPHGEVSRYYSLIDVLVYPRRSMRLTEIVTPLKPLEAMAQGRIFIASDVGGHRELIRDGETGFLFPA
ncbi:MAG: glycosyltransferase, exosortase A system-associated, partial [Candidatus Competibacter sp.]|nr:glycosyltransferase, exosortase A system-associated [Candidatus Competibacter sp.]